jgi:EpsI family protein
MPKASVLAVITAAMTFSALIGNHAVGRLEVKLPRHVPIEAFPRQIGPWKAGENIPIDPKIQAVLPTAKIVEREYKDAAGRTVRCTLITASDILDIHNPNICFVGQGWELSDQKLTNVGEQAINSMLATREGLRYDVRYWFVGDTLGTTPGSHGLSKIFAIRNYFTKEHVSSLFVRLLSQHDQSGDAVIDEFATAILPPLKLTAAK